MSIARKAITSTLWMSGLNYIGIGVGAILAILRDRVLLPYENGVYMFGMSVVDTLFIFAALSFNIAVIQADDDKEDLYSTAFVLTIFLSAAIIVVAAVTGVFLSWQGVEQIKINAFLVLAFFAAINLFTILFSSFMEKKLEYNKVARINFLQLISFPVASYILVTQGAGAWGMVIGQSLAFAVSFIGMAIVSKYPIGFKYNPTTAKWFLSMGWKLIFSRGMEVAFTRAGTLITDSMLGTTLQGSYSRALKYWEMAPQTVSPAVVTVALPTYSQLKHNVEKLSKAFTMVHFFMIRVLLPFVLVFAILSESFLLILGDQWLDAVPVLRVLSIGALLAPVFENMKQLIYAEGKPELIVKTRIAQLVIFLPAMFGLVYLYGISGAAMAMVVNFTVGVIIAFFYVRRFVSVQWRVSVALPFAWAILAAGIVLLAPLPQLGYGPFLQFALEALYLVGIFIVLEFITERKRIIEYWQFVRTALKAKESGEEIPVA